MKHHIFKLIAILGVLTVLTSCKYKDFNLKPSVTGKSGEIVIVTTKNNWESEPGSKLRNTLAVDYPQLPQKEPLFTLYNIPEAAFTKIFQTHRNLIITQIIENLDKPTFVHQKDVWAAPQTVVTISAPDEKQLAAIIGEKSATLRSIFEQAERDRIIENTKKYEEPSLRNVVTNNIGGSPYFPTGYILKKITDNFIWIAYETTYTNQGIFVYRYPRTEDTKLDLASIIEKRNEILEENVPGMFPGSYMTTSNIITPELKWIRYNKRDFAEVRGLWEVQNDFMGGPFVSHSFYDREGKYIIVLEAFVYAPKYDKRNYLRQVESMIYSFEWKDNKKR